ncbi:MAG: four helix bundle protein [Bdellovibrionales bacterium]|jgi:four helix bundle protein|nr:four helix bundle protein [Bdellovibrionales bacterium]MBT7766044.1 four helix bundle protein [Bdellovibrionales bacterium]
MLKKFYTYQLAVKFYRAGEKIKMPRHLKDQFERASSSICLNLAEGSGKRSCKDKRRFYDISLGSTKECQAILDLLSADEKIIDMADYLGACIYRLAQLTVAGAP